MKKKKVDSLLESFNKQKMAKLTELKGKSLDYACAVAGGKAGDAGGMSYTCKPGSVCPLSRCICWTDECDKTNGNLCDNTVA